MDHYLTGSTIKVLREQKGYTQKRLAQLLSVSDKAVSKWETGRGMGGKIYAYCNRHGLFEVKI